MALLKYFKPIKRSTLPLPNGPLSEFVPSSSIEAANKEVESIVSQVEKSLSENDTEGNGAAASESKVMKRGPYVKFSQQAKVAVAKYASEHGVAAGLRHYIKKFPELKESTVRTWRNGYIAELQRKQKIQDDTCIRAT